MRSRAFGVELEFDSGGLEREGVARILRNEFDRLGLRRWHFTDRLGWDGSELELRTPILRGPRGFNALKVVMNTLHNHGCFTTGEDGMHVHHNAPEFVESIDNCIRIVKSWKANRHLIYQFIDPQRTEDSYSGQTGNYWACPAWTDAEISTLETNRAIPHWNRNDLNLNSLHTKGSLEIRLHEGTLNYDVAESWIKFGQRFIDRTLKHAMRDSKDTTSLLKKVQVSPGARRVLLDKASHMYRYENPPRDEYRDEGY